MLARLRSRFGPYRLYLVMSFVIAVTTAAIYTTVVVYRVTTAGLTPIELVLVGTVLEIAYFAFQVPTGLVADLISRRLCVIVGIFVTGAAFIAEGLLSFFLGIMAAQVLRALGFALLYGALQAWIADELGEVNLADVFLRGTKFGQLGTLLGTVLSGLFASVALRLPLLAGGVCLIVFASVLILVMPERNFRPVTHDPETAVDGSGTVSEEHQRRGLRMLLISARRTVSETFGLVRKVPALLLLFGVVAFLGIWHESFDRLWGANLLEYFTFPAIGSFNSVVWFSVLSFVATLISLGVTELVRKRLHVDAANVARIVQSLIVVSIVVMAATAVFGLATSFWTAAVAYWVVSGLRPAYNPLLDALIMQRVDRSVRATMLSAKDMFDSAGQFIGGPAIGGVGTAFSLRAAMVTAAGALLPVCVLFAWMLRGRWRNSANLTTAGASDDDSTDDDSQANPGDLAQKET